MEPRFLLNPRWLAQERGDWSESFNGFRAMAARALPPSAPPPRHRLLRPVGSLLKTILFFFFFFTHFPIRPHPNQLRIRIPTTRISETPGRERERERERESRNGVRARRTGQGRQGKGYPMLGAAGLRMELACEPPPPATTSDAGHHEGGQMDAESFQYDGVVVVHVELQPCEGMRPLSIIDGMEDMRQQQQQRGALRERPPKEGKPSSSFLEVHKAAYDSRHYIGFSGADLACSLRALGRH